jgi:ribosomal protein L12E/L44/L45/RPP1/RPP2
VATATREVLSTGATPRAATAARAADVGPAGAGSAPAETGGAEEEEAEEEHDDVAAADDVYGR